MASSSSSHDVFTSFRGKDVRRTFLSHLLNEFDRRRIIAFVDNSLTSKSIPPELVRAIRSSRISIVILSKSYASSSWCLNELVEIMNCNASDGQLVMTIFYDVDPSDVRKQTGDFGKAFKRTCLGRTEDEKRKWKQALIDVANILGEHSKNWHSEAAMIKKIATDVSNVLNSTPSKDFDNFVGIEAHIEKMKLELCLENKEAKMIGIWGPAGIGKSTIARALYDRLSSNFQLTLFMDNVKASYRSNESYSSKLRLQERFLSELFNDKDLRIKNLGVAEKRLRSRKVLVVLDDVDNIEQLNALADRPEWFGNGSRIIVTTEDKELLETHEINLIYEVGFPSRLEALQIFSQSAFRQDSPPDGYVELANEIAKLTVLPLGLSVLGSSLRGKSKCKWIRALPRLKATLHEDIERILRVGYDSLGDNDNLKTIFLYIACLFNGERKDRLTQLLENSDLDIESGLDVLVERALISISSDKRIMMHHLLQQMGQQIVRRQSIHEPGKRQFLLDAKKINDVLADNTGTGTILGISFNMSEIEELFLGENAFIGMHNLQIIRFYKNRSDKARLHLDEGLDCLRLPLNLRLLHWEACPMKCMPSRFSAKFLVEINMQESKLEKLWQEDPTLTSLKKINLSTSINLKELPDLSKATNLESVTDIDYKTEGIGEAIPWEQTIGMQDHQFLRFYRNFMDKGSKLEKL
ncbi:hypothetical protein AALP_AA3G031900 [Arabis alpina]|uniref:ADP-ribosyl cyclase/cyclic ADP-ribose hydrolase n=1 Tax=Arabis alpina TaxID=50452 RepID=A0A087H6Q6_ARAAL|nr:hypothetical protein AALP_AA3G031900 [Arabis alpina]